ncbi:Stc1 domain protein [Metarhizium robertsii]|uniref:Stc1 domain-containing protein n=2 Tax=Metarhizium robertsii TaxID=568076 RepID=E9EZF3_METRA|nr:uncharacterized protein MAA_05402 [Metarhizium robertsii ARSEF 23]EFY99344.1 hypothetical protein MAA_05402 [Metarhizium robertsii ARSEF 23]EXV04624.1 Stc1 domain protein [Metarhizium robertsii]
MAPNEKTNVKPSPYRCKVGGEWKPLQFFSKNQQQLLQRQTSLRGDVDAANSGMTCIEHSVGFRGEIRCELCGLIKPIDMFSKSMRRSDDPTCLQCTAWQEIQEPGVTPMPLQTGHRSVEENKGDSKRRFTESTDFFPDLMPQVPITALSSLGVCDIATSGRISPESGRKQAQPGGPSSSRGPSSVVSAPVSVASSGTVPPHLESIVGQLMQNDGLRKPGNPENRSPESISSIGPVNIQGRPAENQILSVVGSEVGSEMEGSDAGKTRRSNLHSQLPPHLQGKIPNMGSRATLFQYAVPGTSSQGSDARTISTATTMRSEQDTGHTKTRVPYNAWDNAGKLHEAIKSHTASEGGTASTASDVPAQDPSASGQWESVPATKKGWPKTKNNWHTAPRLESRPLLDIGHISDQHIDPKIDRQKRMNYCDSEDSRY